MLARLLLVVGIVAGVIGVVVGLLPVRADGISADVGVTFGPIDVSTGEESISVECGSPFAPEPIENVGEGLIRRHCDEALESRWTVTVLALAVAAVSIGLAILTGILGLLGRAVAGPARRPTASR